MDEKLLENIKKKMGKQKILNDKEISKLVFYLSELTDRTKNINNFLDKKIVNAIKLSDPIKLADELINFDIELSVSIDYFKDAKKLLNKITDRLYKKYSDE